MSGCQPILKYIMHGQIIFHRDRLAQRLWTYLIHEATPTLRQKLSVMAECDMDGAGGQSSRRGRALLYGLLQGESRSSEVGWACGYRIIFATCTATHITHL